MSDNIPTETKMADYSYKFIVTVTYLPDGIIELRATDDRGNYTAWSGTAGELFDDLAVLANHREERARDAALREAAYHYARHAPDNDGDRGDGAA